MVISIMAKRCEFKKPDGTKCKGYALKTGKYCFTHEPTREADRKAARAKGGQSRANLSKKKAIIGELVTIVRDTEDKNPENGKPKTELNTLQDLLIFAELQLKSIEENQTYGKPSAIDRAENRHWAKFILEVHKAMGYGAKDRINRIEAMARKQLLPTING